MIDEELMEQHKGGRISFSVQTVKDPLSSKRTFRKSRVKVLVGGMLVL